MGTLHTSPDAAEDPSQGATRDHDDPESREVEASSLAAAQHWKDFYDRVIEFEESMLDRMRDAADRLAEDPRIDVIENDIHPIEELIADLKRRRALWVERLK